MLKNRIITALILIPIVIVFIFLAETLWFAVFFAFIAAVGSWEWAGLSKLNSFLQTIYTSLIISILSLIYWLDSNVVYQYIIFTGAAYWLLALVLIISYQKKHNLLPRSSLVLSIVGMFLIIPMWASLVFLKSFSLIGPTLIMFLMLLIWGADTAAYFAGKQWGKRKLADRVSPGKTWEGSIAGGLSGVAIALGFVLFSNIEFGDSLLFIVISVITVIASVFGDLMESMVKREAGQKDSGNILPGHGGVMDRVDSLTAASPVFIAGVIYLGLI